MNTEYADEASLLQLTLHGHIVGYLAGLRSGKNILKFSQSYIANHSRPTLSLITHPSFPYSEKVMSTPWVRHQRLHPTLSNLLPEGSLRTLISQGLKVHIDSEFTLLSYLGQDLPGALIATPIDPANVPDNIFQSHEKGKIITLGKNLQEKKFSLAGVQMKFSMKKKDGRYNLSNEDVLGDWIIKTPSTLHADVPLNEYTAMSLASLVGVHIPEIQLVELNKLDNLPPINLPNEALAFAIKRFDRNDSQRIHMEDFAQVLVKYPHEKYNSANYEQIARVLYQFSGDGLADVQQFARRLLVNILLANGDAHLKNWSLLYPNQVTPRLSPAYDIVTTRVYIENESHYALNLGKSKSWYSATYANFESWAEHAGLPWRIIKPHLDDVMVKARDLWPDAIHSLPMNDEHKRQLKSHWEQLSADFKIT